MTQQLVNLSAANDGLGDSLRAGGDKINLNFTELYASVGQTIIAGAAQFTGTNPQKITQAIAYAAGVGAHRVQVPDLMTPYDATAVVFNTTIQMVREGGNYAEYDLLAYGAGGGIEAQDTAAFNACIAAAAAAGGVTMRVPNLGTNAYFINGANVVIPNVNTGFCIEGDGPGAAQKSEFRVSGPGGAGNIHFNFPDATTIRLARLSFVHVTSPAVAANGICLNMVGASYVEMDDVWIAGFDVNIQQSGNSIYSRYRKVMSVYAYSCCIKWVGALQNGNYFEACQASGCVNGSGMLVVDSGGSAGITLRNCYFEGNFQYGFYQSLTGFINIHFDNCYAEANGLEDFFLENAYPHAPGLLQFTNCYFDPNNAGGYAGHVRVKLTACHAVFIGCKFYQVLKSPEYTVPPIAITDQRGQQPNIAINCEYQTPTLTSDGVNDAGWVIIDPKHPFVGFANADPIGLGFPALKAGSFFYNTAPATNPATVGWQVLTSGMGAQTHPAGLTATVVSGSPIITPNLAQYPLGVGDFIVVGAVTFNRTAVGGGATDAFCQIMEIRTGPTSILVDGTANSSSSGNAVTFRVATTQAIPNPAGVSGSWTPADGSGASLTFTAVSGRYTSRLGIVDVWGKLTYPSTANGSAAMITGLPITPVNIQPNAGGAISYTDFTANLLIRTVPNDIKLYLYTAGTNATNAQMSLKEIEFHATYRA